MHPLLRALLVAFGQATRGGSRIVVVHMAAEGRRSWGGLYA